MLRWENALRRPGWRVEEEQRAWQRMRAEVRRYAQVRSQMATASGAALGDAGPRRSAPGIQNSLTTIRR